MSEEFGNDIITITDDDGNNFEFEVLDMQGINGIVYAALCPVFYNDQEYLDSDGDLVIMRVVEDEDGESILETIESDQELEAVFEIFRESLEEDFELQE